MSEINYLFNINFTIGSIWINKRRRYQNATILYDFNVRCLYDKIYLIKINIIFLNNIKY